MVNRFPVAWRMEEKISDNEAQGSAALGAWTRFSYPGRENRLDANN